MKLSLNWLNDFVDISQIDYKELAVKLTNSGFEVEEIECQNEGLINVVVGKILKMEKHPNADKLNVCKVDVGSKILQILTAATNVFEGALVPVALDGAHLPCGVDIKVSNMRGLESCGMFCGGEELGINNAIYDNAEFNGVLILKDDCIPGQPMADVLGLNDIIFEINVLSNRPDCNSIIGLAREVSAILNKPFKMPNLDYKINLKDKTSENLAVNLNNPHCKRYMAHMVKNIKIEPSPKWMQNKLKAMGLRPINNIVDITNYVLLEFGQPLHAFDYNLLENKEINIRSALNGEKIVALDQKEYTLNQNDIVIADGKKPVAIAGIMGGEYSSINDNTKDIILECATFERAFIRKTSRKIGLRSDSSNRYERGVEPGNCDYGLKRALALICELNAGDICNETIDNKNVILSNRTLTVSANKINNLLAINLSANEMKNILDKLFIKTSVNGDTLNCDIPYFRSDIETIADIAEEVIRIYGFEHVGDRLLTSASHTMTTPNVMLNNVKTLRNKLTTLGLYEIYNFSLVNKNCCDMLLLSNDDYRRNMMELKNPLNEDLKYLRTTLVHNMLTVIARNEKHGNKDLCFFEIGRNYFYTGENTLPNEEITLSIGLTGNKYNFYNLKYLIEKACEILNANCSVLPEYSIPYINKYKCGKVVVDGNTIGYLGEVHPIVNKNYGITENCLVAEINLTPIINNVTTYATFQKISKFPSVTRDFTFLVNEEMQYATLLEEIKRSAGKNCIEVKLTDIYEGNQVQEGYKSMSFRLKYQKDDATLTDEEMEQSVKKMLRALQFKLGVTLRDIGKI